MLKTATRSARTYSLRRRLLATMFAGLVVLGIVISVLLWNYARNAANRSYDMLLTGAALSMLERVSISPEGPSVDLPVSAMKILALAPEDRVFYAVSSPEHGLITGRERLPDPSNAAPSDKPRFFDALYSGELVRFVVQGRQMTTPSGREWVQVQIGQTRVARDGQARSLFLTGVSGLVVLSLISLVFVRHAISRALRPLNSIEEDLRDREPTDLTPLDAEPPREVRRLIGSINEFIDRLRINRARTETFIADVAHQTRTSLAALQGQISLAADGDDLETIRERLGRAETQVARANRLTDQLLSQAMVTHRADSVEMRPVRLDPLVRELLSQMVRNTTWRDIDLSYDNGALQNGADQILADPISIREALRNILENSVRHGPADNRIDVRLLSDDGRIAVEISDAGPGIPERLRGEVFTRFRSLSEETAGSGLGLAIVKSVADAHSADLTLNTSEYGGLRVRMSFPGPAPDRQAPMAGRAVASMILCLCLFSAPADSADALLEIWSATDTHAFAPLIMQFEAENPDLAIAYSEFETVDLYDAMLAPAATVPDIVISSAIDLQVDLVNRGLAVRVAPRNTIPLPDWAVWRSELFGFTFEPAAVVYDTRVFDPADLPRRHMEIPAFLRENDAVLQGRVGTYDIRESGVGYLYATQDAIDGQQFLRISEALGSTGARVFCCTGDMIDEIDAGRVAFAVNAIGSYALRAAETEPYLGVHFFEDYNLVMARSAFVPKDAGNPEAGARFLGFLLSPEGQRLIGAETALLPLATEFAEGSEVTKALARLEGTTLPIRLAPGLLTYLDRIKRENFLNSWSAAMQTEPAE